MSAPASGSQNLEATIGAAEVLNGQATAPPPRRSQAHGPGINAGQGRAGWLFITPALIIIVVFFLLPVLASLWVSLSDWSGKGSPLTANYIGFKNYETLLGPSNLSQKNMATSFRNIFYYVIIVVPLQTVLALVLALSVNKRGLRGKGFFRTAFYFPSVTSSVAISIVFLFLFSASGVVNAALSWFGIHGPNWFSRPDGVLHLLLNAFGVPADGPAWATGHKWFSITWWDWLSGPSIAMCSIIFLAVWTTSGTFMLLFLAALQDVPQDVQEAAMVDGASNWQVFRKVTLPALKPTLFLVITLGLIGTWQMFDQVFIMSQGQPQGTTLTPAYLSYITSFNQGKWGQGVAIAFLLFLVIVIFSVIQRIVMRERKTVPKRRRISSWEKARR